LTKAETIPSSLSGQGSELETIRTGISDAMVAAGLRAFGEWRDQKAAGAAVTNSDLVCAIYAAMLLQK
jgi:hypothetical protein